MRLKEIIIADKTVVDWGKWQEGGRMPRAAFPLSRPRNRAYRLGAFRWRIVRFKALEADFRLLIAYRTDKEQYRAVLAQEHDRDMTVLAQYEFHGTHPGWHVLASCEDIEDAPTGVLRHPWQRRLPGPRGYHRSVDFRISGDNHAFTVAAKAFRLHLGKGQLL